jgi:hypothetical protein
MFTLTCSCCGEVFDLPTLTLSDLPETVWSLVTDGLCDPCWFDAYL